MEKSINLQLQPSCILAVPLQMYDPFTFIVNGKNFVTTRIISDILSPIICKNHLNDPTYDRIEINTLNQGDFSLFLSLTTFNPKDIPANEVPFIFELIKILQNESILYEENQLPEITLDNVLTLIKQTEKSAEYLPKSLKKEIDFIISRFDQICEDNFEDFSEISIDTLLQILNSENLSLKNEDQLLNFVNKLFLKNKAKYSLLYETVIFQNISNEAFQDFVSIFDTDYMNREIWLKLTKLIKTNQEKKIPYFRYAFKGIVNNLKIMSNDHIEKEIKITAPSLYSGITSAYNVTLFDDNNEYFGTNDNSVPENNWICFEFKNHKVVLYGYTIRSHRFEENYSHAKNWVIQCSNDGNSWVTVDERKDCDYLNGLNFTHTFEMNNMNHNAFKYVRMQITGKNWQKCYYLFMDSIEFYGKLV